jgi:anti-sigma B factor antagonist
METSRPVVVKRMPERLNQKYARALLREIQPILTSNRPQVVFDMSLVRHLDAAGVDMLLHCMKQAMKRDGDLKLASLSPQAAAILELTRTDRLFEIYGNATDAMRSFSHFMPNAMRHGQWPALGSTPFPAAAPLSDASASGESQETAA